MTSFEI